MKNRMMSGIVMILFLTLFTPCRLWAETGGGPADTKRARELQANVPQTPEELLLVINALFVNPDEDGHDFCEKRLGIDRANWRKSKSPGTVDGE